MPVALLVPGIRTSWRCRCVLPLRLASVEAGPAMRSLTWKGEAAVSEKRQSKDLLTRIAVGNMSSEIDNVHDGFLLFCALLSLILWSLLLWDHCWWLLWWKECWLLIHSHHVLGWSHLCRWSGTWPVWLVRGIMEHLTGNLGKSLQLLLFLCAPPQDGSFTWLKQTKAPKESCVQAASNFRANQWLWLLSLHPPETAGLMIRAYKAG